LFRIKNPDCAALHPGYGCCNHRVKLGFNDGDRATIAVKQANGKRLTYKQPH
jgi:hypothetical protein